MSVIRKFKTLTLAAFVLALSSVGSDDIAVVVDVSGNMKHYGAWQADAKEAVTAILAGRPLSTRWTVTPPAAHLSDYTAGAEERATLLLLGAVGAGAVYPYFDRIGNKLTVAELAGLFPTSFADFTDNLTNNALAEAVAISSVVSGSRAIRVISISDFGADAGLSDAQIKFVSEMQGKYARYTDATISWAGNPRVQIKLLRFVAPGDAVAMATLPAAGSLVLSAGRLESLTKGVELTWWYDGPAPPEKYDLRVVNPRNGKPLFSKTGLGGTSITYTNVAPGPFRWTVTAYLPDGRTVDQSAMYNVPDDAGGVLALFVVLLVLTGMMLAGLAHSVGK